MTNVHWRLHFPLLLVASLAIAAPASAQDTAASATSFAEQFFISHRINTDGEKSVEVLGSLIIWFLMLLSVVSMGLIGTMALNSTRKTILPAEAVNEVRRLLAAGEYRQVMDLAGRDRSYFSQILSSAIGEASHGFSAVVHTLEQVSDELANRRLRRLEYLNVLGQVSPMIGLFGTVYGMILAFGAIVAAGGNADPSLLAGGISTALTTTFWGLVVAIPALAAYGLIRNQVDELTTEATLTAQELLNHFRPKSSSKENPALKPRDHD